ncbi:hypothetical protein KUTeg_007704 [Tegillarca granosa]|uniref:Uncharacterized protein n=1 Tax=Tegillarca granosa TaxID=220873 RepID=A0ABQ9FE29_TEGGR|nr:hypothetical protein KUTeg_007704 [Tegillarca granosa]
MCDYLKQSRLAAGIVNSRIVTGAAQVIIMAENKSLLNMEEIIIWASSILLRLNIVKKGEPRTLIATDFKTHI